MNTQKIIEILDPQAGKLRETILQDAAPNQNLSLFESKPGQRAMTLQEAVNTAGFPVILRDGLKAIVYESYAGVATTWQDWVQVLQSDKQSEDWVESNAVGELPIVHEGTPYPEIKRDLDRTLNIRNYKRGDILEVTEEAIRFDKIPQLRFDASDAGRRAANTREQSCYTVVSTAGNYVRNSTTGDNDIGANTAATVFSASGVNTALTTIRTSKDRKSGVYFGANPDTLIVTPRLEVAAKQLLMSSMLQRVGGSTTNDVYGGGVTNPFRGLVNRIIVSPRLGTSYQWVLMEAKRAVLLQEVEGLQVQEERQGSTAYFNADIYRFRVRDWFGVGMLNDRFAYYSSTTGAPVVD